MKQQTRFLLLTITFSIITFNGYSQDLLDAVKSNSKLVAELKDTYRAFHINNIIVEQKEMINIVQDDASEPETKKLLGGYIKACDSLKNFQFNDAVLNEHIRKFLASTVQSYQFAQRNGFGSAEFKKDSEKYEKVKSDYLDYLYTTYSTGHFVNLTEETYYKANNKNNYFKSGDYQTYKSLKATNLKEALALLEKISAQTTDFQEYAVYQIEAADQYVKQPDGLNDDAYEIAISKYKAILEQNKYSIYLFEAWLKWRLVSQQHVYGLSKTSDIPNNQYDKMREKVALTILDYITKNDKDEMAINEFLLMATHDIVKRFGKYPYGNQNTVEYHQTFD